METNTFWQLMAQPWLGSLACSSSSADSSPCTGTAPSRIVGFECSLSSSYESLADRTPQQGMLSTSLELDVRPKTHITIKTKSGRRAPAQRSNSVSASQAEPRPEIAMRPCSNSIEIGEPSRGAAHKADFDDEEALAETRLAARPVPGAGCYLSPTSAAAFPASTSPSSLNSQGVGKCSTGTPPQKPRSIFEQLYEARADAAAAHASVRCLQDALRREREEVAALQAQLQALALEKEELLHSANYFAEAYYAAALPAAPALRASL